MRHGFGYQYDYKNYITKRGEFREGKFIRGEFRDDTVSLSYEGGFKNEEFDGCGVLEIYEQKDSDIFYDGTFLNGKFHGNGELVFVENGKRVIYNGEFKNAMRHGIGEQRLNEGFFKGYWENDEPKYGEVRDKYNNFWKIRYEDDGVAMQEIDVSQNIVDELFQLSVADQRRNVDPKKKNMDEYPHAHGNCQIDSGLSLSDTDCEKLRRKPKLGHFTKTIIPESEEHYYMPCCISGGVPIEVYVIDVVSPEGMHRVGSLTGLSLDESHFDIPQIVINTYNKPKLACTIDFDETGMKLVDQSIVVLFDDNGNLSKVGVPMTSIDDTEQKESEIWCLATYYFNDQYNEFRRTVAGFDYTTKKKWSNKRDRDFIFKKSKECQEEHYERAINEAREFERKRRRKVYTTKHVSSGRSGDDADHIQRLDDSSSFGNEQMTSNEKKRKRESRKFYINDRVCIYEVKSDYTEVDIYGTVVRFQEYVDGFKYLVLFDHDASEGWVKENDLIITPMSAIQHSLPTENSAIVSTIRDFVTVGLSISDGTKKLQSGWLMDCEVEFFLGHYAKEGKEIDLFEGWTDIQNRKQRTNEKVAEVAELFESEELQKEFIKYYLDKSSRVHKECLAYTVWKADENKWKTFFNSREKVKQFQSYAERIHCELAKAVLTKEDKQKIIQELMRFKFDFPITELFGLKLPHKDGRGSSDEMNSKKTHYGERAKQHYGKLQSGSWMQKQHSRIKGGSLLKFGREKRNEKRREKRMEKRRKRRKRVMAERESGNPFCLVLAIAIIGVVFAVLITAIVGYVGMLSNAANGIRFGEASHPGPSIREMLVYFASSTAVFNRIVDIFLATYMVEMWAHAWRMSNAANGTRFGEASHPGPRNMGHPSKIVLMLNDCTRTLMKVTILWTVVFIFNIFIFPS